MASVEEVARGLRAGDVVGLAHDFHPESQRVFNELASELNARGINIVDFGGTCAEALVMGSRMLGLPVAVHVFLGGVRAYRMVEPGAGGAPPYADWRSVGYSADLSGFSDYYFFAVRRALAGDDLEGVNLVVDLSGGAYQKVLPRILGELGARVTTINAVPGASPRRNIGPESFDELAMAVDSWGADAGVLVSTGGYELGLLVGGERLFGDRLIKVVRDRLGDVEALDRCGVPVDRYGLCADLGLLVDPASMVPSPMVTSIKLLPKIL